MTRRVTVNLGKLDPAVLAARFLAERYGILLMKGLEELSGDATANIRLRAKRAAKASILMMGFCIRLLLIKIITETEQLNEFDIDLCFLLVEKVIVYDDGRLLVCLLDGTEVECVIE